MIPDRRELGVSFDGSTALASVLARARAAEAAGASSLWVASHMFLREPFTVASLILSATSRIRVSLMSVSPYMVHPVYAAMAAATLDECFPGRVVLCLGTGAPFALRDAGVETPRPLDTLREALDVVRALLSGRPVTYRGEIFHIHGRALGLGERAVPVYLAASGPRMLQLAGAAADGVVLSAAASVEFVRWAVDHVERGAKGRRVQRVGLVYASVSDGTGRPADRFRRTLSTKLATAHHRTNVELARSVLDADALTRAVAEGRLTDADALLSEDVIARHSVSGTPEQVRAGIQPYYLAGLDEVVIAGTQDEPEMSRTIVAAKP